MTLDTAESLAWAAFPNASQVIAKYLDANTQIGIAVAYGDVRKAIRFNPKRHDIHSVLGQLQQQFEPN